MCPAHLVLLRLRHRHQGVLRSRQQALKSQEEEQAAAAASSYRRVSASGNTANAPLPVRCAAGWPGSRCAACCWQGHSRGGGAALRCNPPCPDPHPHTPRPLLTYVLHHHMRNTQNTHHAGPGSCRRPRQSWQQSSGSGRAQQQQRAAASSSNMSSHQGAWPKAAAAAAEVVQMRRPSQLARRFQGLAASWQQCCASGAFCVRLVRAWCPVCCLCIRPAGRRVALRAGAAGCTIKKEKHTCVSAPMAAVLLLPVCLSAAGSSLTRPRQRPRLSRPLLRCLCRGPTRRTPTASSRSGCGRVRLNFRRTRRSRRTSKSGEAVTCIQG